ncbi:protein translocase subunit SecF, partial [Candidatus Nomurabacteria bacterium]|nr:protein translocase subunit SecF [Candidatus Nomurabacteria bacterium]
MFIIKNKKIFVSISAGLVLLSIIFLATFGLKIGIDFKGGALIEVVYDATRPAQENLDLALNSLDLGVILIQPTGEKGYLVKSRDLTEKEHTLVLETLSEKGKNPLKETNFNSIGPSVGRELARKAIIAIILVSLAIVCFIAFAFRHVSKPVSSWKYGSIAIITLLHDVMIPVGLFVALSRYYGAEVDTLFVVAVLTILGLSVSDTIVIFDRIRENLKNQTVANRV